jgi:hypothetical protein
MWPFGLVVWSAGNLAEGDDAALGSHSHIQVACIVQYSLWISNLEHFDIGLQASGTCSPKFHNVVYLSAAVLSLDGYVVFF